MEYILFSLMCLQKGGHNDEGVHHRLGLEAMSSCYDVLVGVELDETNFLFMSLDLVICFHCVIISRQ